MSSNDQMSSNTSNNAIFILVSENNPELKYVLLDKEPITLGRTPQTGIEDIRLSKKQLKFEADYDKGIVMVEQLGNNNSAINKKSLVRGEKRLLNHGDKVSLLVNRDYTYELNFVEPPDCSAKPKKRSVNWLTKAISPKKLCSSTLGKWEVNDGSLLVFSSLNLIHKSKVAAFDMDGTIITTQSGKVYPQNEADWKINFPEVIKVIRKLSADGYKIVLFTNQAGIGKMKINEETFKEKIENIVDTIKTPVQVFVATQNDIYRKPAPGMWSIFLCNFNGGLPVFMNDISFYCGDAAGRPERIVNNKRIKKDHSCCDRLFAMNIGLKFFTPEEYFLNVSPEKFQLPKFNPSSVLENIKFTDSDHELFNNHREIVLMVGCPGSGKSHFVLKQLEKANHMRRINRDLLGNWQNCVREARAVLKNNKGVVIDNTNPDKESRKRFIELAKEFNVPCRVFMMNTSKEHAKHNNKFRELTNKVHQKISDLVINSYFSKFEEPSLDEGIDNIVKINFVPHFKNNEEKALYKMYLL